MVRFAHLADLHLGGWRDPEIEAFSEEAFKQATAMCINEKVDFIIIAGDFFDTAMPSFEVLDFITIELSKLKAKGIPVYSVAGSHDFSPSGKTFLRVLESAGLLVNVGRASEDDPKEAGKDAIRTPDGTLICGISGRKAALDENTFIALDKKELSERLNAPSDFKILAFHAGIKEFLPGYLKEVDAMPLSLLPKGFDYYATGHIHHPSLHDFEGGTVAFPGALFPANFAELERFGKGGFYIVSVENGKADIEFKELKVCEIETITVNAEGLSPSELQARIEGEISELDSEGFILLIRLKGTLKEGAPSDINFRHITEFAAENGAIAIRRNISALGAISYSEVSVKTEGIEEMERNIISESIGKSSLPKETETVLIPGLMAALDIEKLDGEGVQAFKERTIAEAKATTGV